jgi:hypothetical protein
MTSPTDGLELERLATDTADAFCDTYRHVTRQNFEVHRAAGRLAGPQAAARTVLDCMLNTTRALALGQTFAMEWDPEYPLLGKLLTLNRGLPGRPNADASYHVASLHGDHTYRLRGDRGTARVFDAIVHRNSMATRDRPLVDSFGARNLEIPAGEDVEIVLSRREHEGLWLQLPEGDCFLYIRQYFYDWGTEEPARLTIERDGAIYPPPDPTPDVMARRAEMLNSFLASNQDVASSDSFKAFRLPPNTLEPFTFVTGAFQQVQYICGYALCRPDEALVIEFAEPVGQYWSVNVTDAYGGGLQPHMRQASLNGHQAQVDPDGVVRLVLAHTDPGVANWLDCAGRDLTTLAVRLHNCETAPPFRLSLTPLAELGRRLHAATRRVSPAERQANLRARLLSAYRRGMLDA